MYNITAFVNDSLGQANNTALASNVRFDNTKPVASISCGVTSIKKDSILTCTCSATDGDGSGENETARVVTANPSTALTGTFTTSCDVTDYVGLIDSSSWTYTVTGSGGGTTSGGSTGGTTITVTWKKTHLVTEEQFKIGSTKQLPNNERFSFEFENETQYVGVLDLTSTTATVKVEDTEVILDIGDEEKFDLNNDGYYDLSVNLNSISADKADITIKAIREEIRETVVEKESSPAAQLTTTETLSEEKNLLWLWILIGVIVIILVVYLVKRNKQ